MSKGGKRVQMIPTTLDIDRIEKSLIERTPDRVYILHNKEPLGIHEDLNDEVLEAAQDLVEEETMCYRRDEVEEVGIEFYRFDEALVDIFGLMYKESQEGNQVFVNVSGGTKPVAIALAYCSSIIDSGIPMYYVAEDYTDDKSLSEASSKGVVETTFQVSPLPSLNLTDLLPDSEEQEFALSELMTYEQPVGVKNLLANAGEIADKPPDDEQRKEGREDMLSTYHQVMRHLDDDDIVEKDESEYALTDSGELIAKLVQERKRVDKEIKQADGK
jgi:hypothetical protein